MARRPLVVAHRGGSPADIDNSSAAFEHALRVGAHLLECDLRLTGDGEVVLHHDETAAGIPVWRLSVDELRARVPTLLTLAQLLDLVARTGTEGRFTFDLKQRGVDRQLAAALRTHNLTRQTLVTTTHSASLRRLAHEFPGLRLGLSRGQLVGWLRPAWTRRLYVAALRPVLLAWLLPQLRWSHATAVVLQHRLIDRRMVTRCNQAGYRVYAWTVDDRDAALRLAACGVDMVATNVPAEMLVWLGWRGADDARHGADDDDRHGSAAP